MQVLCDQHSAQRAVDGGDEDVVETVNAKLLQGFLDAQFRAHRPRGRNHDPFHGRVSREGTSRWVNGSDEHAVMHDGDRKALGTQLNDVGDRRVQRDAGRVGQVVADPAAITDGSFGGQSERCPRRPPADEVVDLREPQLIEPTRGSGAEVSMLIEAVDQQRLVPLETLHLRCLERLQRQADGAGEMLLLKDGRRQHVDERRVLAKQALRAHRVDALGHDGDDRIESSRS